MDGLQMLSARGPFKYEVHGELCFISLGLPAHPMVEVRGASFSAASRDPERRRFADIESYFTEGHRAEYPCSLWVRVTVRDVWTGKSGLLWEEGKGAQRSCPPLLDFWEPRLPEGSQCANTTRSPMVCGGADGLGFNTTFYVCPEPNQEGVGDEERLYRVATAEDNSQRDFYPFEFVISTTNVAQVGSVIRSLCK
jgi:hypothetical protein